MDCIHIKLDENNVVDFDIKVDRFKCWSPWSITFHFKGAKPNYTHTFINRKKLKEVLQRIEQARADRYIDCT